jgi:hypothetical protein
MVEDSTSGLPLNEWSGVVIPTSNEVIKMNAINHKPMITLK